MFNMGFGEGFSWAKGICQKLERSADEYFEACSEYVNTASKHVKKLYEEICEWEVPYDIEGEVYDLNLTHDTINKLSNESSVEFVDNSSNEKNENLSTMSIAEDSDTVPISRESRALSPGTASDDKPLQTGAISCSNDSGENCKESSDTFSFLEDSDTIALSGESVDTACDVYDERLQTGAISCSNDSGENCKESSDTFTLPEEPKSSLEQDSAQLLESCHDAVSSTITDCGLSIEADGMTQKKMGSCINEYEPHIGPNKFETSGQFHGNETAEVSDSMEVLTSCTPNTFIPNAQSEEFEAIMVEDCGDGSLTKEMTLISHSADKNMSFKKKLKNVFISRKGRTDYNCMNHHREDGTPRMQDKQPSSASSVSSADLRLDPLSREDSIETEWEVL